MNYLLIDKIDNHHKDKGNVTVLIYKYVHSESKFTNISISVPCCDTLHCNKYIKKLLIVIQRRAEFLYTIRI